MTSATILAPSGPRLGADEARFFAEAQPWGFILFARNVETPDQLRALTAGLRAAVGRDAPVLIDQEGGRVQRLRAPHWREWRPALDEAMAAGADAGRVFFLRMALIAAELRGVGIDTNCAPVADIASDATHAVLRNRCCGTTPDEVAGNARAAARGLLAGGCLPVVKHMPGHGRAALDSHLALPRADVPRGELDVWDFAPFRALADLPVAMTCHLVFPAIDPDRPATQSDAVLRVIRDEIGFGGLLLSDDLSMQALSGSIGDRARLAVEAGCDIALHCNGRLDEMQDVVEAAGRLTGQAAERARRALAARPTGPSLDLQAAAAEFQLLTGRRPA